MKKSTISASGKFFKSAAFLFGFIALASIAFTSCENFMKGGEVKEEIISIIDYNNAPLYPINVEVLNKADGVIKTPATGEVEKKVTDTFTVRFDPSDDHVFLKWEAIVKDLADGEDYTSYVQFEDETSLETKVTFKKASEYVIVIRPVCPERLSYTLVQSGNAINPRDSSIEFIFNQPISDEGLLDSADNYVTIQNLPEDSSASTYLGKPEVNGNKLVFCYDISNGFIPFETDLQKAVSVKIPKESLCYVNTKYSKPVKVYLDSEIRETFFINSETSKKVTVNYSVKQKNEQPIGILKINGNEYENQDYQYSVGANFTVRYKLPENYTFKCWSFLGEDGNVIPDNQLKFNISYEDNADTYGYDSVTNAAQMNVRIYNTMEQAVTIAPQIYDPVNIVIGKGADESATFKVDSLLLTQENTEFECGLKKSISLVYKYSDAYKFYGWKLVRTYKDSSGANKTDQIEISAQALGEINFGYHYEENALTKGHDVQTRTAQIVFTILDYIDGTITITPIVSTIPVATIKLDGSHGKFNPVKANYEIKEGSVNSIGFEPDNDYGFISWKVYNVQTGAEIANQNYIAFEDACKENTTYTLVNMPEDNLKLAIKPFVSERPQILSRWPEYDAAKGSKSDTTIEIVFDHSMDPDSILYTDPELKELAAQGITENNLKESSMYPGRYYGYEITKGNETIKVLKNIEITDKRSGKNIAKFFDEPTFEDPTTLFIPVKTWKSLTAGMIVIVTVSKDFFYEVEDIPVTMVQSEKWRYLADGKNDDGAPSVTGLDDSNPIEFSIEGCDDFEIEGTAEPDIINNANALSSLNGYFLSSGDSIKLTLNNVRVSDQLSYPKTMFTLVCKKVYDDDYNKLDTPQVITKSIDYDYALGDTAMYSGTYELTNLEGGVYAITYKFKDRSDNATVLPEDSTPNDETDDKAFYFVVDTKAPELNGNISEVVASRGTNTFKVHIPDGSRDIQESRLEYKVNGSAGEYTPKSDISINSDVTVTGLTTAGQTYQVRSVLKDWLNHTYTSPDVIVYTKPNAPSITSCTAQSQSVIDVTWSKPSGVHNGYELYYRKSGVGTYTKLQISDDNQTTYRLQNLSPNTKYDIYMRTKNKDIDDYSAATSVTNAITKPAAATVTGADAKIENGNPAFDITWNKPAAGTYGTLTLYISKSNAFTDGSQNTYSTNITNNAQNKLQITKTDWSALEYDTTYYVKIVSTASEGGDTSDSSVFTCYSYLSKITNLHTSLIFSDSVQLAWTNTYSSTDSGFKVYKDVNGTPTLIKEVNQNACAYGVMYLKGNTTYKLGIQRCRTVNGSVRTSEIEWLDNILTTPEPVTRLRAIRMLSPRRFNTTWVNPVNGYSDISVYLKEKGGEGDPELVTDSITTSNNKGICDISLPSTTGNVIYEITVRTSNASGYSECTIEASTLDIRVRSFDVFYSSESDVTLLWESPARSDTYKYYIYFLTDSSTIPETPDVIIDTQNPSPALVTDHNGIKLFSYTLTDSLLRYIDTFMIAVVDADGKPANGTNNMESVSVTAVVPDSSVRDITYLPNITSNQQNNTLTVKWTEIGVVSFDCYKLRVVLNVNNVTPTIYDVSITRNDEGETEYVLTGAGNKEIVAGLRWLSEVYIFAGIKSEDGIGKGYRCSEPGNIERP